MPDLTTLTIATGDASTGFFCNNNAAARAVQKKQK